MQINSKKSLLSSKRFFWLIKLILFVVVFYAIYLIIKQKGEGIFEIKNSFKNISSTKNLFLLSIVILLTPINWAFEAWKWQKLASKIEEISFWEAYKGVLVGLAISTATPMMIGDYVGKIWMLKTDKRLQSIGAILLGNGIQMYVSLFFGTVSYLFFVIYSKPTPLFLHFILILILILSLFFGIILSRNLHIINLLSKNNKFIRYLKKYLIILENYNFTEIRNVFLVGIGRYLIFTIQFIIILNIFNINLSIYILLAGIGIIFLAKTLSSVLNFLGDLSVRELTSVYYFSYFGVSLSVVATATLMIWLINVLLPILVGSLLIWYLRNPSFKGKN